MTDVTSPQIETLYRELYNAAIALQKEINTLPDHDWKKTLMNGLAKQLPTSVNTIDALKSSVKQIDIYLEMHSFLMNAAPPSDTNQQQAIQQATQRVIHQRGQIARAYPQHFPTPSDEVPVGIDLSQLDDVEPPCQDAGFHDLIRQRDEQVAAWTRQLLNQNPVELTTAEVKRIIQVWGEAIHSFVEDALKQSVGNDAVLPGQPATLSRFFCIHDELEALYDELSDLALTSA